MKKLLRDPLLHFLVLGLALFLVSRHWRKSDEQHVIRVDAQQIQRIAERFTRQYGGPPTALQLQQLVDGFIREEVLYREALMLGLDRGDEITRRRIVQKFEFLQQDSEPVPEPDPAALEAFYRQNQEAYISPERFSFSHVYFSVDRGGEDSAQARARETLAQLNSQDLQRAPDAGDRFPGNYDYANLDQDAIRRGFGDSQLSEAMPSCPPGRWAGPFRSGFGWHIVHVSHKQPATQMPLAGIRDQVREDYLAQARARQNAAAYDQLREKYVVVRADEER